MVDQTVQRVNMASEKKRRRLCKVLPGWFEEEEFKDMIKINHPKNTEGSVYCLICEKTINIEHQGRGDPVRHFDGAFHKKTLLSKKNQSSMTIF